MQGSLTVAVTLRRPGPARLHLARLIIKTSNIKRQRLVINGTDAEFMLTSGAAHRHGIL